MILWLGVLSVSATAAAEELQTVTIIDLSVEGKVAREITHDVARALMRRKDVRYRAVDESLNVGAEEMHRNNVRSALGLLRSGRKKLKRQQWEEAAEELDSAVTGLLSSFAHVSDQEQVREIFLLSAVALHKDKQRKLAARAFERAVAFHPKHKADLSAWGQDVVRAYEQARERVLLRPPVQYEVKTSPANAEVWVNGRYYGLSPTFVRGLKGPQFVRLYKAGRARVGKLLQPKADGEVLNVTLPAAHRKAAYDDLLERFSEVFDGVVEPNDFSHAQGLLVAPRAVLIQCTGTREKLTVKLALANLSGRQVVHRISKDIKWLRRDKKTIEALVGELFRLPKVPRVAPREVRTDTVFRKWWFWTAVGVVAAGATTAALVLSRTSEVPDEFAPGTGGLELRF